MVMLCFLLDLRPMSPSFIRAVKESLLLLGNYYAVSSSSEIIYRDLIGVSYISERFRLGPSVMEVAYAPKVKFNLRNFYHCVNLLPIDGISPMGSDCDPSLTYKDIAHVLRTWKDFKPEAKRKVIVITSDLYTTLEFVRKETVKEAIEKGASMKFDFFPSDYDLAGAHELYFKDQIGDMKNCELETQDADKLYDLAKTWFQELKVDVETPLLAQFVFRSNLAGNLNQITCKLCTHFNPIPDGFPFSPTCKCHGLSLDRITLAELDCPVQFPCCPVSKKFLEGSNLCTDSLKIGEETSLHLPSFQHHKELERASSPIYFSVLERANLACLREGLLIGATFFVTPSTILDNEMSQANNQREVFQVVCNVLNSLGQGLVCSSNCNIETATETSFKYYYLLSPAAEGMLLLRRLLASEEFLCIPDDSKVTDIDKVGKIEKRVKKSLLKMEVNDYDPAKHRRGFHEKLNSLVRESLEFGPIPPETGGNPQSSLDEQVSSMHDKKRRAEYFRRRNKFAMMRYRNIVRS